MSTMYWCTCGREFPTFDELDSHIALTTEHGTNTERHDHKPEEAAR